MLNTSKPAFSLEASTVQEEAVKMLPDTILSTSVCIWNLLWYIK